MRFWRPLGVWLLVWTVIGMLRGLQEGAQLAYAHEHIDWIDIFSRRLLEWYTAGAITPLYILLVRRLPAYELAPVFVVIIYVLAVIGGFFFDSLLYVPLYNWAFHGNASLMTGLANDLFSNSFGNAAIFAAVIAIEHYRLARQNELRSVQLEAELSEARLQALRSQLDPHFLFNTLNSISSLIHTSPKAADEMLLRLSNMFRKTLEFGSVQEIRLRDEIEFLTLYLEIMRVRFSDDVATCISVPDALLDQRVPNFILQPIVENSFRHGIGGATGPLSIEVSAQAERDGVMLIVADSGPGFPPESEMSDGIGLGNTRRRLQRMYGDEARMTIANRAKGGATVRIWLPRRTFGAG